MVQESIVVFQEVFRIGSKIASFPQQSSLGNPSVDAPGYHIQNRRRFGVVLFQTSSDQGSSLLFLVSRFLQGQLDDLHWQYNILNL